MLNTKKTREPKDLTEVYKKMLKRDKESLKAEFRRYHQVCSLNEADKYTLINGILTAQNGQNWVA